jgi:hypothetical protein
MPSSAVPNTDLPDPDLPDAATGLAGAATGLADTATGSGPADDSWGASATRLRCGGCGASAVIDHGEHQYGGLVRGFLAQHSGCGNAVQISRTRPGET